MTCIRKVLNFKMATNNLSSSNLPSVQVGFEAEHIQKYTECFHCVWSLNLLLLWSKPKQVCPFFMLCFYVLLKFLLDLNLIMYNLLLKQR